MIINIDAATYTGRIQIGKQGENLTTDVVFDCNAWLDGLDGGTLSIVHQRNSDPDAYPCGDYTTDGKVLTWNVNETDLAYCGLGQCELRYTIGERIAKSKTFVTQTLKGLDPNETPPEAWEPYIDRVIDAATHEMENMTVSASATSGEQTSVSVTKTRENDHEHIAFNFTVEKGDKGEKGEDGKDGKSIVNVIASIDANVGTPSVTVTTSSSDAGLSVDLDFHNMKGIPGASFDTSYLPSDTASGSPATFHDGAKNVPVDELVTTIVPQQDLHGYSKPWPAGGGKNKFDINFLEATGITIENGVASGKASAFNTSFGGNAGGIPIPNLPQGQLTLSFDIRTDGASTSGYGLVVRFHYTDDTYSGANATNNQTTFVHKTMTSDASKTVDYVYISYSTAGNNLWYLKNVQLESSASETSYEPYANICPITGFTQAEITHNSDTDTIPFGQTVYGGELNVTTGVLTIDKAVISDLSQITWGLYNSDNKIFRTAAISGMYLPTSNDERNKYFVISSYAPSEGILIDATMDDCGALSLGGRLYIRNTSYSDATVFKNSLSGVQLAYRLATPTTVQLTPDEVRTVLGSNSISSNCGVVSVRYRADIGLYIDKKLS